MKGATEVPSTITVIIIQYTLIKRMKCELAFPISPTYCLNVKYSSHGLSPWKHTGAGGISHLATTLLPQEWRNGGIWGESWNLENHTGLSHKNLLRLSGDRDFGAAFSLSLLPFSFLAQGTCPSPRGFLLLTLGPWACSESWVSHSPEGSAQCPQGLRKCKRLERLNKINGIVPISTGNFLKHLFSPSPPKIYTIFDFIFPRSFPVHPLPKLHTGAARWAPAPVQNTFQWCWGTEIRWFVAFPSRGSCRLTQGLCLGTGRVLTRLLQVWQPQGMSHPLLSAPQQSLPCSCPGNPLLSNHPRVTKIQNPTKTTRGSLRLLQRSGLRVWIKLLMSPYALPSSKTVLQMAAGSDKETSLEHTRFKKGKNPFPALLSPFQWGRSQHHVFYPVIPVSCLMHIINPQWFGLQLCAETWQSLLSLTMLPCSIPQLEIPGLLKKKIKIQGQTQRIKNVFTVRLTFQSLC